MRFIVKSAWKGKNLKWGWSNPAVLIVQILNVQIMANVIVLTIAILLGTSHLEDDKMCPKPLRDLFEEAGEQAEEIFGEDNKL